MECFVYFQRKNDQVSQTKINGEKKTMPLNKLAQATEVIEL